MRAVIQRVVNAQVEIDENIVGKINTGFVILLGIKNTDTSKDAIWLANKIISLRVFEDENGKMNRGIEEINGEILLISQFTLYGDCRKGKRPSFIEAARPEIAIPLYEEFKTIISNYNIKIETGVFGADMKVSLINDGPVTLIIDSIES
jgi:D-tyrosyl-tRNA(Tyr) deacylase